MFLINIRLNWCGCVIKDIIGNGRMLGFIPEFYKDQNICNKAVDNDSHALRFVHDCYKIQKSRIVLSVFIFCNETCSWML